MAVARHTNGHYNNYYNSDGRYHDDNKDDDDDDEFQSLMQNNHNGNTDNNFDDHDVGIELSGTSRKTARGVAVATNSKTQIYPYSYTYYHKNYHRYVVFTILIIMTITLILVLIPQSQSTEEVVSSKSNRSSSSSHLPVYYECPIDFVGGGAAANDDSNDEYHKRDYEETAQAISDNVTEYLSTFHNVQYDNWGYTYDEVKSKMYHFKSNYFPKVINELKMNENKNGEFSKSSASSPITIYESASGIGLNLYMTLEILNELNLTTTNDVYVYGNEYLPISTEKSINILNYATLSSPSSISKTTIGKGTGKGNNIFQNCHVGILCAGDSTKLNTFVPANSFDIVYCGYISPLEDPLKFNLGERQNFKQYTNLCYSAKSKTTKTKTNQNITSINDIDWKHTKLKDIDWMGMKLNDISQRIQNEWYATWITQMIYIAKPGAAIIIEQVSSPYCTNMRDWGGVAQSWWYDAIKTYNWDIDNTTIEFEQDTVFAPTLSRYHVYMRKNKAK